MIYSPPSFGEIPYQESTAPPDVAQREDGSWLIDRVVSIERFRDLFDLPELPDEGKGLYNPVGGFVTVRLRRIPAKADRFTFAGLRIEVVDMDQRRVSELLVSRLSGEPEATAAIPKRRQTGDAS
jgi:putative hemolysin